MFPRLSCDSARRAGTPAAGPSPGDYPRLVPLIAPSCPLSIRENSLIGLSAVYDDPGGYRGLALTVPADDAPGRHLEILPLDLAALAGVRRQDTGSAKLGPVTPGMTSRCAIQLDLTPLDGTSNRNRLVWGIQRQHIRFTDDMRPTWMDVTAGEDSARPSPSTRLARDDDRFRYVRESCG